MKKLKNDIQIQWDTFFWIINKKKMNVINLYLSSAKLRIFHETGKRLCLTVAGFYYEINWNFRKPRRRGLNYKNENGQYWNKVQSRIGVWVGKIVEKIFYFSKMDCNFIAVFELRIWPDTFLILRNINFTLTRIGKWRKDVSIFRSKSQMFIFSFWISLLLLIFFNSILYLHY